MCSMLASTDLATMPTILRGRMWCFLTGTYSREVQDTVLLLMQKVAVGHLGRHGACSFEVPGWSTARMQTRNGFGWL